MSPSGLLRNLVNAALRRYRTTAFATTAATVSATEEEEEEEAPQLTDAPAADAWNSALLNHLAPEGWDLLVALQVCAREWSHTPVTWCYAPCCLTDA